MSDLHVPNEQGVADMVKTAEKNHTSKPSREQDSSQPSPQDKEGMPNSIGQIPSTKKPL